MKSYITEPLGLYGYKELEPVFLAALASETPLLLVGRHGTGKSLLLERLSLALNKEFRYYNASLLNYDDLVGIPYPSEDKKSLHYIYESSAIWEAEAVFFDEINRCRPDLQNKLFPIINEKMIQGKKLNRLIYRFAAMNPPYLNEDMGSGYGDRELYEGVNHLDNALSDRFGYLVAVPEYRDLSLAEKSSLLSSGYIGEFPVPLDELIAKTKEEYEVVHASFLKEPRLYFAVTKLIEKSFGYISPRRVKLLFEGYCHIHASRKVLSAIEKEGKEADIETSLLLALENCLPYITNIPLNSTRLKAIISEASKQMEEDDGGISEEVLSIDDPEERFVYALTRVKEVPPSLFGKLIPDALSGVSVRKSKALALFAYFVLREKPEMAATDMRALMKETKEILEPNIRVYPSMDERALYEEEIERLVASYKGQFADHYKALLVYFLGQDYAYQEVAEVGELSDYFLDLERRIYGREGK